MKELKPFDLEAAERGDVVLSPGGIPLYFVGKRKNGLVVLESDGGPSCFEWNEFDLRMAPKKRTVWVNLWEDQQNTNARHFPTREKALENAEWWERTHGKTEFKIIATAVPVEIEE